MFSSLECVCTHVCVCILCTCSCVLLHTCVCVCMMAKGQCQKSSLVSRYLTFLETGSLWTWSSLTELVAGQWTHWSVCLCFPQGWACRCMLSHLRFCMDTRYPNSGPHPCSLALYQCCYLHGPLGRFLMTEFCFFHESMPVVCLGIRPFHLGYLIFWCTSVESFLL